MTIEILIAVDPTQSFCPGGELPVPEGDAIMPVINALTSSNTFNLCILVTEEHPEGHISFASRFPGKKPFDIIQTPDGAQQTLWPDHSIKGTNGCQPHPALNCKPFTIKVVKGEDRDVDSHSAFLANNKQVETPLRGILEQYLKDRGLSRAQVRLTFVGLALDYCVGLSALDARQLGFRTRVLLDGTRSVRPESELVMLRSLAERGIEIDTARALLIRAAPREPAQRIRDVSRYERRAV